MEYMYGALLLHKAGKPVNEENMKKVIEAAGGKVDEAKVKTLVASLKDVDIDKELETAAIAPAETSQKEDKGGEEKEKEKEEKKEEAAEGLGSLFG